MVTVIVVAIFLPNAVSKGSPSDEVGDFASSPTPHRRPGRCRDRCGLLLVGRASGDAWSTSGEKAKQGAAIFRDRRRYAREVAVPSGVSYGCRMGVTMVFMAAFGIPVTVFTVFLVAASHTLSQLFAITPGVVGQTQALDLRPCDAMRRPRASPGSRSSRTP